jgi:hypothetical protein
MVHVNQGSYIHMYAITKIYIEVDIFDFLINILRALINKNEKKKKKTVLTSLK